MVFRRCLLAVALDVDSDDYGDESAADEEGHYDEDAENNDKECDDSIGLRHIRRPLVLIPWMFSWGNVFVELRARGPRAHATGKRKSKGKDK